MPKCHVLYNLRKLCFNQAWKSGINHVFIVYLRRVVPWHVIADKCAGQFIAQGSLFIHVIFT